MNLFQEKDYKLVIDPIAYTLKPFKIIWDRDKTKGKKKATQELAYIYYMCDYKSDFSDIFDPGEKHRAVAKQCMADEGFEPDEVVKNAMEFYESRQQTLTMRLYKTAKIGISKIEAFINNINLEDKDRKTGKPIYNVNQINSVIKELVNTSDTLEKLEKRVRADLEQQDYTARGNKEKSPFEDGI